MTEPIARTTPEAAGLDASDRNLVTAIAAHTELAPRGASERLAFETRLQARLSGKRGWSRWLPAPLIAAGALAAVVATVSLGLGMSGSAPPPERAMAEATSTQDGEAPETSFLALAYYGAEDGGLESEPSESSESYLPADMQIWADGLEASGAETREAS